MLTCKKCTRPPRWRIYAEKMPLYSNPDIGIDKFSCDTHKAELVQEVEDEAKGVNSVFGSVNPIFGKTLCQELLRNNESGILN